MKTKLKSVIKKAVKQGQTIPVGMPVGFRLDKQGVLVLPKAIGECVDLLYRTREARLQLQRQAERLEEGEKVLRDFFIDHLPKSESTGVAGSIARVQIEMKHIPQVDDWTKFYAFVKRNDAFELLQRRLNESAVKERWEDKKEIPGVGIFNTKKVSCTKL